MTKLFQIEEPDGSPADPSAPGAAVGIALAKGTGAVAFSVGGNPEILPSPDGEPLLEASDLRALLVGLRMRAERQLGRPVTHAVVALPPIEEGPLALAAEAAGLALLRSNDLGTAPIENAVLEAAVDAEDLAPKIPS
ncbi:MAG TPA: hypothetical protein VKV32_09870 [Stellaceae bacterium]|nr:hypothetical protein [Stellaceae bacterium]